MGKSCGEHVLQYFPQKENKENIYLRDTPCTFRVPTQSRSAALLIAQGAQQQLFMGRILWLLASH